MALNTRRALSLLEVLLASAVLALLAIASVPLIQQALAALVEPSEASFELDELADIADRFLADPTRFGVSGTNELVEQGSVGFPWPFPEAYGQPADAITSDRAPITARCLLPDNSSIDHVWVLFECDGQAVARWVAIPRKKTEIP